MSKFVEVRDKRYNDLMLVNIDNISYIALNSGIVLMNGTHGEQTGLIEFDPQNLLIITNAIDAIDRYAAEREQSYKKELLSKVNRFEVIDETGRAYIKGSIYGSPIKVEMDLQDDGRTLKVFVQEDVNQTTDSVDIGTRDVNGLQEGEGENGIAYGQDAR